MITEFFTALLAVAAAELGDKTQFIALLLAARYAKQKWAIILGLIAAATLMHGLAATLGFYLGDFVVGDYTALVVGILFIVMGLAILRKEPEGSDDVNHRYLRFGAFAASFLLFSLSEIADKSQIATMMLAAHYEAIVTIAAGAVVGMVLLLVPVVFFGAWLTKRIPMQVIRYTGFAIFVAIGILSLYEFFAN
ncbi:TMEM165/GDT1 family protein [Aliidiomarina sanyensis]|uniref:GDT1 family protein n=1 Tax=Aliidiomarina sanyensis TaxID=1249555 RepID=A0A432WGM8_9GAMM|nr:TMEM165/GDT1 family protein [Aliidiomarina sanyensis]RUO32867.1 hypothetical protein CWE11_07500 [Aliidiomarina sanyensis]